MDSGHNDHRGKGIGEDEGEGEAPTTHSYSHCLAGLRAALGSWPSTWKRRHPKVYLQNLRLHLHLSIATAIGAPQMTSQPVSSILLRSPLPSGTWRTPGLSISWYYLPTSSSACPVFFPPFLCLARLFWPDLMNGRHVHATFVCISLRWSGGLRVVRLPAGSWHGLPRW